MLYSRSVQTISHKDLFITLSIMFLEVKCKMKALYVWHESSNSTLLSPDLLKMCDALFVMCYKAVILGQCRVTSFLGRHGVC